VARVGQGEPAVAPPMPPSSATLRALATFPASVTLPAATLPETAMPPPTAMPLPTAMSPADWTLRRVGTWPHEPIPPRRFPLANIEVRAGLLVEFEPGLEREHASEHEHGSPNGQGRQAGWTPGPPRSR
jgi:hypothetical protein